MKNPTWQYDTATYEVPNAGLAFVAMRRVVPQALREELRDRGLWMDLIQEVYAAALEAQAQGLEGRALLRFVSKCLYSFLRANGYRRPRGSSGYVNDCLVVEAQEA